jgi:hypothetical protein
MVIQGMLTSSSLIIILQKRAQLGALLDSGDASQPGLSLNQDRCKYLLRVYPSEELEAHYNTNMPIFITLAIAMIFVFTGIMFALYDCIVERRQRLVLDRALRTTAIVSSLFPEAVRDRLMGETSEDGKKEKKGFISQNNRLKSFLNDGDENGEEAKPIADLFPYATVLFADIAGFTAWSSTREPAQVFILLQTVYQAFDVIANKYRVFKVETIGDSYVAVTGLPNPQANHALLMARFAIAVIAKFNELVRKLEVTLGPDTGDLAIRVGMHSGPVTAGVLRGERARFQLFGDTVNTAARLER